MTDEVKVSIVVPVYNAEKTLKRCVDSIIQQSYTNWELLLIDDGSTDCSKKICEEYCQNDVRVVYFYKYNGGASSARNYGIAKATGQYISFIDSDDWIEAQTVEKLLMEALSSQAEYVIPRMRIKIYSSEVCIEERYDKDAEPFRCNHATIVTDFLSIMKKGILFSASGRLYSLDYIRNNEVMFPENIKILEDFCFNLRCIEKGATLSHISYVAYNFYVEDIGKYALKRNYEDFFTGIYEAQDRLMELFRSIGVQNDRYYNNFFIGYWGMALNAVEKQERNLIKRYRFQQKVAKEVKREKLMENYSAESIDRSIRYLFLTGQPMIYNTVKIIQKIKLKLEEEKKIE